GLVISRFGSRIGLRQRFDGLLHDPEAHPLAIRLTNDGAVMRAVDRELLLFHSVAGAVGHANHRGDKRTLFGSVLVEIAIALLHDGFQILVDRSEEHTSE